VEGLVQGRLSLELLLFFLLQLLLFEASNVILYIVHVS